MFRITPMVVAFGPQREKSRFTYMHDFGVKIDIPYMSWLIQGKGLNVLVDTGCSAEDYRRYVRPSGADLVLAGETFKDVQDVKPLEEQLAERGLTIDDIDIVIQTHLDWDHCMNTRKFKKSKVLVQRYEFQNVPGHVFFKSTYAPKSIYEEIASTGNMQLLDGDYVVTKGLEVITTPGHSPMGQSIVVDTEKGRHVIAGMCTVRDNFYPPEEVLSRSDYQVIPAGMHYDPVVCYNSMLRIKEVGGDN
ncbi:MAG: N-acyl homoserine lactonase family protein, partial [Candidatus Eremiobacteraeota bacterium]|nr:N-acyl homoserine lactonase family protein [Candidatus Eremiobacteraeota bacterium]